MVFRKIKQTALILVTIMFLFLVVLTLDNNHIITVVQTIPIENLPEDLEGFTILQITDLHEKEFGENQEKLLEAINSIDYDAIVLTGDMLSDPKSNNYEPFYTLIEGISNKEIAFFVPGNTDPKSFIIEEEGSLEKDEFIKGMEERGVRLLDTVQKIKSGNSNIYFTYFHNSIVKKVPREKNSALQKQLLSELAVLDQLTESDTLIALNHYPAPDAEIDYFKSSKDYNFRSYDLIIAGHYHGGQIRVPLIGAIFVPEPWYRWGGILPPRDRVKGLWNYKGIQQYVSAGLGSSDAIPFMKFRFLNPPEINVLTLTGK